MLQIYYSLNILRCKRLKVKLVCYIKVCTDCLRVVVDDDCLVTLSLKCPCAVNWTVIELDTLSDSDRAWTKYHYFLLWVILSDLVLQRIKAWIVIWSHGIKLCCTCINHLEVCCYTVVVTHLSDLFLCLACESRDNLVRELNSLDLLH